MANESDSVITPAAVLGGVAAVVALFVPAFKGDSLFAVISDDFADKWMLLGFPLIGAGALAIEFGRAGTRLWHSMFAGVLGVFWYASSSQWFNTSVAWDMLDVSDYVYFAAFALFLIALKTRPAGRH